MLESGVVWKIFRQVVAQRWAKIFLTLSSVLTLSFVLTLSLEALFRVQVRSSLRRLLGTGKMSHWVCIYSCLSLTVLFLKGASAGFAFLLSG